MNATVRFDRSGKLATGDTYNLATLGDYTGEEPKDGEDGALRAPSQRGKSGAMTYTRGEGSCDALRWHIVMQARPPPPLVGSLRYVFEPLAMHGAGAATFSKAAITTQTHMSMMLRDVEVSTYILRTVAAGVQKHSRLSLQVRYMELSSRGAQPPRDQITEVVDKLRFLQTVRCSNLEQTACDMIMKQVNAYADQVAKGKSFYGELWGLWDLPAHSNLWLQKPAGNSARGPSFPAHPKL